MATATKEWVMRMLNDLSKEFHKALNDKDERNWEDKVSRETQLQADFVESVIDEYNAILEV